MRFVFKDSGQVFKVVGYFRKPKECGISEVTVLSQALCDAGSQIDGGGLSVYCVIFIGQ